MAARSYDAPSIWSTCRSPCNQITRSLSHCSLDITGKPHESPSAISSLLCHTNRSHRNLLHCHKTDAKRVALSRHASPSSQVSYPELPSPPHRTSPSHRTRFLATLVTARVTFVTAQVSLNLPSYSSQNVASSSPHIPSNITLFTTRHSPFAGVTIYTSQPHGPLRATTAQSFVRWPR